jgi:hypothetical protein
MVIDGSKISVTLRAAVAQSPRAKKAMAITVGALIGKAA